MSAQLQLEVMRLLSTEEVLLVAHTGPGTERSARVKERDFERLVEGRPVEGLTFDSLAFQLCVPPTTLVAFIEARLRYEKHGRAARAPLPAPLPVEAPEVKFRREAEAEVDAICTALKTP